MWQELPTADRRPPERDVTITDVEVMGLQGNPKSDGHYVWGIVVVRTDTDAVGIGETFRGIKPLDIVERMAPTVIGENPLGPQRIADKLAREHYTATGGIGRAAIAALETACWDIKGKLLDVPVYELLGGAYRTDISLYSDSEALASPGDAIDFTVEYTPESYAEAAREVVDAGFDVLKFDLDVPTPGQSEDRAARRLTNDGIDHKVALIAAVRDEIGDKIDLGVDLHWSYTVETATRLGEALSQFDLAFIEDPVHHTKLEAQSRVKQNLSTPVLTGENLTSAAQFTQAVTNDILDIAAPDVAMCGGLAELRQIASLCDQYGIPLAPHNLGSPVATVAGAHLGASIPNFYSLEFRGGDTPWWDEIVTRVDSDDPIITDGMLTVPDDPGLGIEFTDVAAEYVTPEYEYVFA